MRNVAGVNDASPQDWFKSIPLVTKILTTGTFLSACLVYSGYMSPSTFIFSWERIRNNFEIWRLFTPFIFAGSFGFPFVMHLMVLYENSRRYENNAYNTGAGGTSADYLWMLLLFSVAYTLLGYVFDLVIFSDCLIFSIAYVWSRREPNTILSLFGFKFPGLYLPWSYLCLRLLFGQGIKMGLLGIGVGHVYFFLAEVMPQTHGRTFITTPNFCIKLVQAYTGVQALPEGPGADRGRGGAARGQGAGYQWGRGRVLGAN